MRRTNVSSDTEWESVVGYSRLVRVGDHVAVTGTTATTPEGGHVGDHDAHTQTRQALQNIESALARVGATLEDIVRTRIYVTDIARDWEAVGSAHREVLGQVRPATSMVEVSRLIENWMLVEIEADALIGARPASNAVGARIRLAGLNEDAAVATLLTGHTCRPPRHRARRRARACARLRAGR
jgi:enamine deaminase RidA (YjgF/YER057c/UK114 family)